MNRQLDNLTSEFRPKAMELIARATEAGIALMILCTLRTAEEQEDCLRRGVSATPLSRHLPRSYRQIHGGKMRPCFVPGDFVKSDAIDVCPYEVYQARGPDKLDWDAGDPVWDVLGAIGEKLGLVWGGRWKNPHDPGHFELP